MAKETLAMTSSNLVNPTYVHFEPYCEWQKNEGVETLVVHLPDFKRDQLRVQVNTLGILKISGEKTEQDGKQRKRFYKETKIPEGCDIKEVRARLTNHKLHITMPRKPQAGVQSQEHKEEATNAPQQEASVRDNQEPKRTPSSTSAADDLNHMTKIGNGSSILNLLQKKNKVVVGVGIGIAVVAVVALGAYVALKCGGSDSGASSSSSSLATSHLEEARHD